MFENYTDVMSVEDVCNALNIGKNSLYKLLRENTIKSLKVGKKYLIPKICLIDYIEKCRI